MASLRQAGAILRTLAHVGRRLSPWVHGQWRLIFVAWLSMILEVAMRLFEPWPLKYIFDRVIRGHAHAGPTFMRGMDATTFLLVCVGAMLAAAGLRALFSYIATIGMALAGNRVLTVCRKELFDHLLALPILYHAKAKRGDLVNRLVGDVGRLQEVAITALLPLVSHVLTLAGMLALMMWMDIRLGLVALAVVPVFTLATAFLGRRIRQAAKQQRTREGEMAASAGEMLGAIRVVQAYSLERLLSSGFDRQNTKNLRQSVRGARLSATLERTVDLAIASATAAIVWIGAVRVVGGQMTPGDLVVFIAYLKNAFKPMRDAAKFAGRIAKAAASGERIFAVIDEPVSIADSPGAADAPRPNEIAFDNVTVQYAGHAALQDFSLTIPAGRRVALVGPSGAGKTTALTLLMRLQDPVQGRVAINGVDIRTMRLKSVRALCAPVLQESVLFGVTIRENIASGAGPGQLPTDAQIRAAAELAGALSFIERLPQGFDTVLGERGETLSGGERQRLAIARAAIRNAPILMLDEPTAGLDARNADAVLGALDRVSEGRTVLVVSHDLSLARSADLVVFLDHGRIVEKGSHEELMAQGGRYASLYAVQNLEREREQEVSDASAR